MTDLRDLFSGKGAWEELSSPKVQEHEDVMGKKVDLDVDKLTTTVVKNYKVEYVHKDEDAILHFFLNDKRKNWPVDFVQKVKASITNKGDEYDLDYIAELNSWFFRIYDYSKRRLGAKIDAKYISSILESL